jgi:hypothetical protein
MLSRCRCGVVIVTNKVFLQQPFSQDTLVAKLSQHVGKRIGRLAWTSWKDVAQHEANLPGASGSTDVRLNVLSPAADMKPSTLMSNTGGSDTLHAPPMSSFPPFVSPVPSQHQLSGRWSVPKDVATVKAGLSSEALPVRRPYSQSSTDIQHHRAVCREPAPYAGTSYDGSDMPTDPFPALCNSVAPISATDPSVGPRPTNATKWTVPLQIKVSLLIINGLPNLTPYFRHSKQAGPSHTIVKNNERPSPPTTNEDFPSLSPSSSNVSTTVGAWASSPRLLTRICHPKPSGDNPRDIRHHGGSGVYWEQTSRDSSGLSTDVDPFPALCEPVTSTATVNGDWASSVKIPRQKSTPSRQVVFPNVKKQRQTMSPDVSLSEEGFPFLRRLPKY